MVAYSYAFQFDPATHKGFNKATRRVWGTSKAGPAPVITKEQAALLTLGLCAFDMDYKWMGNLTNSNANAAAGEVVVRLYRTWTSHLVYEARYRPSGEHGKLRLHEFAWETDANIYNGNGQFREELESYQTILHNAILDVIIRKIRDPESG